MERRAITRALLFLLVVALLVGACATGRATPTAPARLPLKLVVQPFLSNAPLYIALAEGYFVEEGLEVEPVEFQLTGDAVPPLVQGQLDVLGGLVTAASLNAIARGANIKIVADKGHVAESGCDTNALVARTRLLDEGVLSDAASLRGMVVNTEPANSIGFLTERLLRLGDLTLEDIEIVSLAPPEWPVALERGALDVLGCAEPWVTRVVQSGSGRVWRYLSDFVPGHQVAVLMFGSSLLTENKEAGRRFMVAYLKAVRQYNEGKTERNLEILMDGLGLERDLLQQACWPAIRSDGKVNVESLVEYADWAVDKGLVDSKLTADQFCDPSFTEYANQVLGP